MKEQILKAALKAAEEHGYNKVTRAQIAEAGASDNITSSNVQYHLRDSETTRREIVLAAVRGKNYKILAQAMALGDPLFLAKSDNKLRRDVVTWLKFEHCDGI